MAKYDPTRTRPLPNQRPVVNPMLRGGPAQTPLNLGALATAPTSIGALTQASVNRKLAAPGYDPNATRMPVKESGVAVDPSIANRFYSGTNPSASGTNAAIRGIYNSLGQNVPTGAYANTPSFPTAPNRPGTPPMTLGGGAAPNTAQMVQRAQAGFGGAAVAPPQNLGGMAGRPFNQGPQNMPGMYSPPKGTFQAANRPNNAYGGGGGIGMNIPDPALTQALMMGAQTNAMNSAVGQANNARVSGPLNNVITTPGSNQALGQWMAQQQNAAHANIGNDPTRGGVMALSDYVNRPDGSRVLGNPNNYADATQMLGGRAPRDLSPGAGGAGTSGGSGSTGGSSAASGSGTSAAGGTSPPNGAQQLLDPLVAQFQGAMDQANAANDQRYDQGLGMLQANQAAGQADLARMGQSRAQEIRDDARRAAAAGMQNLTARGLANTTNLPTMQRGVARDANRAQTALGDVMAQNRFNQNRATTNDIAQWIYQRDDQAPSFDTLANLALGLAQSQVKPPAFDINSVLDRLGRTPSIQDLLSMLPQLQGGNLQQPYMQYPNLPRINFPQQIQGGAGNDQIAPPMGLGQFIPQQQPNNQVINLQPPGGFGGGVGGGGVAAPQGSYGGGGVGEGYYDANGNWIPYMIDQQGFPVSQTQFPATSYTGGTQGNYSGVNADYWNGRA